jgi:hypothetical protein
VKERRDERKNETEKEQHEPESSGGQCGFEELCRTRVKPECEEGLAPRDLDSSEERKFSSHDSNTTEGKKRTKLSLKQSERNKTIHTRFNHVSNNTISNITKYYNTGAPPTHLETEADGLLDEVANCDACAKGKGHRASVCKPTTRVWKVLECVSIDILTMDAPSPYPDPSPRKQGDYKKYLLVIVDAASGYSWVEPIATRKDNTSTRSRRAPVGASRS